MSNEKSHENMNNQQPENISSLSVTDSGNCVGDNEIQVSKECEGSTSCKVAQPNIDEKNTGVAIKNIESESLNSLLVYDSDSSSSSEMMKLNLNWKARDGSEDSSTSSSSSPSEEDDIESPSEEDDDDDDEDEGDNDEVTKNKESFVNLSQDKGAIKKNKVTTKTDGELTLEQLPPVPDLSKLTISDSESFMHMGNVLGIVDKLVTVAAIPNTPAYDLDTLLFLENGKRPLGFIFDVLGQVTSPIYAVRFNSVDDIKNLEIQIGTKVYSAPSSKHTQYVFLQQLLKMKGSDASWLGDNEVPPEFADFSDDENECYQHHGNKKLSPHIKRTYSGDSHKKFENTMNRRNILNTNFNKYMDSYKQARLNKVKSKRSQAAHIATTMPVFDPSIPPPSLGHHMAFYHQPLAGAVQVLPPECADYMVYDIGSGSGSENNNSRMNHRQGFTPNFFMSNFVANLNQTNSANYFTNHAGNNLPGPSHE